MIGLKHALNSLIGAYSHEGGRLLESNERQTEENAQESEDGNQKDRQVELESTGRKRTSMKPLQLRIDMNL